MADTILSNAFISLNDVINNFIISYTGPGKLIPDSKRTEVIFHARRCLQEFAYETLKSQFTAELATLPATFTLPADFVSTVSVVVNGITLNKTEYTGSGQSNNEFAINYTTKVMHFSATNQGQANFILKYLSNVLNTSASCSLMLFQCSYCLRA